MGKSKVKYYECIHAASNWYIVGKQYELVTNEDGHKGFIAEDGLFDLKSLVISKFKLVE